MRIKSRLSERGEVAEELEQDQRVGNLNVMLIVTFNVEVFEQTHKLSGLLLVLWRLLPSATSGVMIGTARGAMNR